MFQKLSIRRDAIISALNEDGTRGVAVNVVVTPTNIDPADLKFNLVNSEGATIFEEAVVSTPKGALQSCYGRCLYFALCS